MIQHSGKLAPQEGFRLGLIAFRDHPFRRYQDKFVTDDFGGFTFDVEKVKQNLQSLTAEGGDDLPEAVTAALAKALTLDWRPLAAKMIVLIADAPPHGIGEEYDNFPDGSPDGELVLTGAGKWSKHYTL